MESDADRALAELRESARRAGLLERSPEPYLLRLACGVLLLGALAVFAWTTPSTAVAAGLALGAAFVSVQVGFAGHDAGHGAVSERPEWNALVGHVAFTVVNGLGFGSWTASHDAHHAWSQQEGRDPDMEVDVVMSLTPDSARAKTGLGARLRPWQALYLWPASALFAHSLRLQSVGRSYRDPARYPLDVALLPLHYAFWLVLPVLAFGASPLRALGVYLVLSAGVGVYLALLFWVNHVGMPRVDPARHASELERQVVGTRNVRVPAALDWLWGGLQFQVEHHLLPGCPGARLRRVQPLAIEACRRAGVPYHSEAPGEALASVTRHVSAMARLRA